MIKYDSLPDITDVSAKEEEEKDAKAVENNCEDDHNQTDCLIHGCTRFSTPLTFLGLIVPLYTIMLASATYFGGCISTIEKHFQLSSSQTGVLATVNDIVSLLLIIFATYYGGKCHRPRLLSLGGITVGVGYFLLALPHFTSDPIVYSLAVNNGTDYKSIDNKLCSSGDVVEDQCASGEASDEQSLSTKWLVIGQILIGLGSSPTFPLIITYLDDSTIDSTTTSIYIAIITMAVSFGPLIGFLWSAKCLSLYVDFYRVDERYIPNSPRDPRWIGAWWLGFAVISLVIVLISIPLSLFPRKLKKYECTCCTKRRGSRKEEFKITEIFKTDFLSKESGIIASILALKTALKRIITNPTVVFLSFSSSCDLAIIGGFAFFSAKYVEKQFALSPAIAAFILGGINLPGSVFANILSAFFVRKLRLGLFGLSKMVSIFAICSLVFAIPLLFIGCSNPDIAGATAVYNTELNQGPLPDFNSKCNSDCACSERAYTPVCGSDGVTYASACYAGCSGHYETSKNHTKYIGCRCIDPDDASQFSDGFVGNGTATEGPCRWFCDKVLPFAVIVAVITVFTAMKGNPGVMLSLRCVDPDDRALSMAFSSVITKVIGFFPAPIYFGALISGSCLVRQESCIREGACLVYDLPKYRFSFIGVFVALKLLAVIFSFFLYGSINPDRLEINQPKPMELVEKDNVQKSSNQPELNHA